jgi:membrane-associated phospholipid phosphatase
MLKGIFGVTLIALNGVVVAAQAPTTVSKDPRDTTHAQHQAPFFTQKDAMIAGLFAVATITMLPLDKEFARGLQNPDNGSFLNKTATGVEAIASPGAYFIGGGMYVIGRAAKLDRLADLGLHGTEAVMLAELTTYMIKGIAGRGRPFLTEGKVPTDFDPGRGFKTGDFASFPSGHTTTAFAAAAAVTNETTRWWPNSTWIVGPLMYGGATAVGLSRMYHNRHWASDVVVGAMIGTFSGRKLVQYVHGHPGNKVDRLMLRTSVVSDGHGGRLLMVSIPTR